MKQIYISESDIEKYKIEGAELYDKEGMISCEKPLSLEAHDAEVRKAAIQRFAHKLIDSPDMSEWGLIGQDTIERIAGELVNECNR